MTLDGHVENGGIVLDDSATLPEGTKVRVEVLADRAPETTQPPIPTLYERLRNVVGKAQNLPEATQHYRCQQLTTEYVLVETGNWLAKAGCVGKPRVGRPL